MPHVRTPGRLLLSPTPHLHPAARDALWNYPVHAAVLLCRIFLVGYREPHRVTVTAGDCHLDTDWSGTDRDGHRVTDSNRHPADGDAAQSITTDAAAVHPDSAPTVHRHAVCLHSNLDAGTYTDLPADLHSTARRDPDAAANHDSLTYFGAADQHATADFGTADACATPNRSAPTFTNAGALADGSTAANSGTVIDIAT